ncbi:MAG: hypothetical protein ACKOUK_12750, partial [Verrucomicrobiota bacterium]
MTRQGKEHGRDRGRPGAEAGQSGGGIRAQQFTVDHHRIRRAAAGRRQQPGGLLRAGGLHHLGLPDAGAFAHEAALRRVVIHHQDPPAAQRVGRRLPDRPLRLA